MIKKYEKQDAPAWQRRVLLIIAALFSATMLLLAAWAVVLFIDQARIDSCLDEAGSWDDERGECDIDTSRTGT